MSLVPLLFSNWWQDLERPHRLFDQNFGHGLEVEDLLSPDILEQFFMPSRKFATRNPAMRYYSRPWSNLMRKFEGGGTSTVKADKNKFQVVLDVQQFKPEEINVKVVERCVVVEAKHEEKQDEHGWISRQFVRRYIIPEQCNIDDVASSLSSDGVLTITVPKKEYPKTESERSINIEQTGKPALQENAQGEEKNQEEAESK